MKGFLTMTYSSTLLAVKDIERSKQFYHEVLGLDVTADFGVNVTLTGGITLQTLDTWIGFLHKNEEDVLWENNASELYFEESDIDSFWAKLKTMSDIKYLHPMKEHSWGQRVIRFYDPDRHIIEVGEAMSTVVKRFLQNGLTPAEVAARMDVPYSFVQSCLQK